MIENCFSKAMDFRYACKHFDPAKKIDEEHWRFILKAGRLSPSSFGMEPWRFLVAESSSVKERLRPLCWNQAQITDASHLVIYLAAIENVKPASGIPAKRFARRPLPPERIEAYNALYADFMAETFADDEKTFAWSARQVYIALANMMTAAASIGIDSCPIEGFEKEKLEAHLKLDTEKWQVAVLCAFGYRNETQPPRMRLSLEEIVEQVE